MKIRLSIALIRGNFLSPLTLIFAVLLSISAFALSAPACASEPTHPCADFLVQPVLLKIRNRVLNLNPKFVAEWPIEEPEKLESWIITLRTAISDLLPFGAIPWKDRKELSPELVEHIKRQFGKSFRVDEMEEKDVYLFYANSLHSVYLYAVREWMELEVETIWKGAALGSAAKNFGLSIMSRATEAAILNTHYVFPERVSEILAKKGWLDFAWIQAIGIFLDFQNEVLTATPAPSRTEIQDWIAAHPLASSLSVRDRGIIETGLTERKVAAACCLTDPGCTLCPNNRAWLRKKPGSASGTPLAE